MPGRSSPAPVVELHLGVERARRRDRAWAPARTTLPVNVLPGSASSSTWASLPDARSPASSRSLTVMKTRSVSTRATVTIAPPPGGPTSVPGSSRRCDTTPVERRFDARLAEAHRQRARSAPCGGLLRRLGGRELALRLLQLLLRDHRLPARAAWRARSWCARAPRTTAPAPASCARRPAGRADRSGRTSASELPVLHPVAAIDQHRVEVAERLRARRRPASSGRRSTGARTSTGTSRASTRATDTSGGGRVAALSGLLAVARGCKERERASEGGPGKRPTSGSASRLYSRSSSTIIEVRQVPSDPRRWPEVRQGHTKAPPPVVGRRLGLQCRA